MYYEHTLSNGIRVIGEAIPFFRSVSVGLWLKTGSVNEAPDENGISHFIEHMLFKGTARRTAKDIATEMDSIGAQLNAFTAKECTCYYVKLMDEHLATGLDLLSDMLMHSLFDDGEIAKEKGVVTEEINMSHDNPEDYVHELLSSAYFREHSLARPIAGSAESVSAFTGDGLLSCLRAHYGSSSATISIAGNFDPKTISSQLEEYFGSLCKGENPPAMPGFESGAGQTAIDQRDIEQVHIALGLPAVPMEHELMYPLSVFNTFFGGSMSSRLFQTIREERGLAYSVYSCPSAYTSTGFFTIYAGVSPSQVTAVLELLTSEMDKLLKDGFSKSEFQKSVDQLKGNYIMGLESTSSRMSALGKNMTLTGKVYTPEEVLAKVDAVTPAQVSEAARYVFDRQKLSAALVGNTPNEASVTDILGNG